MGKDKIPVTPAIRTLKEHGVEFILRTYKYEERGGTPVAARELGVDEHRVIKTLVMEDEANHPFLVLMHGDREVSTKGLARHLQVKTVRACEPDTAHKHTGYLVGGTSPFGTRKPLKTYVEASILELPSIYINAGKKGLLAEISPGSLKEVMDLTLVQVAV